MQNPRNQSGVGYLYSLSKDAAPATLAREAEELANNPASTHVERGAAFVLWGYALLRMDAHKHQDLAADLVNQGVVLLDGNRQSDPFMVDWATLMTSLCLQLMGTHAKAAAILEQLLALPDLEISHRAKGAFSRAFSLYALGRESEALATYLDLAAALDSLPLAQHTLSTRRERQRVRLNIADHYLNACDAEAANYELSALEQEFMTPLMMAARLAAQARVAMMRDQWVEAEQIANRANDAALEVNYTPLRLDALGVLVACAARKNSRDEQHRLVTEMATLLQAK